MRLCKKIKGGMITLPIYLALTTFIKKTTLLFYQKYNKSIYIYLLINTNLVKVYLLSLNKECLYEMCLYKACRKNACRYKECHYKRAVKQLCKFIFYNTVKLIYFY